MVFASVSTIRFHTTHPTSIVPATREATLLLLEPPWSEISQNWDPLRPRDGWHVLFSIKKYMLKSRENKKRTVFNYQKQCVLFKKSEPWQQQTLEFRLWLWIEMPSLPRILVGYLSFLKCSQKNCTCSIAMKRSCAHEKWKTNLFGKKYSPKTTWFRYKRHKTKLPLSSTVEVTASRLWLEMRRWNSNQLVVYVLFFGGNSWGGWASKLLPPKYRIHGIVCSIRSWCVYVQNQNNNLITQQGPNSQRKVLKKNLGPRCAFPGVDPFRNYALEPDRVNGRWLNRRRS